MKPNTITTEGMMPVRDLPVGEYVKRKPDAKATYIRGQFDRASKRYSLADCDNVGREIWVRGDTFVFVGFEY